MSSESKELQKKKRAIRGLRDLWYLGSAILKLGMDEEPRPRREIEPIYRYVGRPRKSITRLPIRGDGYRITGWRTITPEEKLMRALCVPRFLAKTYICCVKVFQAVLKNPDIRCVVHCNEKEAAEERVAMIRDWFELPQIIELYGAHKSNKWSAKGLISAKRTTSHLDPTIRPMGLDKPPEGKRAHLFVLDDLIGLDNYTPNGVLKVERRIAALRPLMTKGAELLYPCTRWGLADPMSSGKTFSGEDGILKKWLRGEWDSFGHRGFVGCYAYPGDEDLFPYAIEDDSPEDRQGRKLLFPSVWSEEAIEAEKREMPFGLFASQVMNDPLPEESVRFSQKDMQYFGLYVDGVA